MTFGTKYRPAGNPPGPELRPIIDLNNVAQETGQAITKHGDLVNQRGAREPYPVEEALDRHTSMKGLQRSSVSDLQPSAWSQATIAIAAS